MVTETKKASDNGAIAIAGLLVAIGIALAGYWMSDTLYKAKKLTNTVSVKGLAERELKANLAIWEMTYNVTGGDLKTVQEQAERSQQIIREFFRNHQFSDAEIFTGGQQVRDLMADPYNQNRIDPASRFVLTGTIGVRTDKVDAVNALTAKTGSIITQGVAFTDNQGPVYKFTKLNDIKPEMVREATQNAREAAEQFGKDSNTAVKGIANASQGFFTIEGAEGFEYKGDQSVMKKIRVVTTITFYLG